MKREERILILCVDRDNDISLKSGLKTPIIGRDNIQQAAIRLILTDPEESDANAMFEAARTYDRLSSQARCEVAAIAGHEEGGIRADMRLTEELDAVLERFQADKAVIVTDGFADEFILPVIQSRLPVMSVRRIVVKHSKSLEEFGIVLTRYARRVVEDPYYSRFILGIPGLLIAMLATLWFFNLLRYASPILLITLGLALFVKGFKIDERVEAAFRSLREALAEPHKHVQLYTSAAGAVAIAIGFYRALVYLSAAYQGVDIGMVASLVPKLVAEFITRSVDMIVAGTCIILIGRAISYWFTHDVKFWHQIIGVTFALAIYPVAMEASYVLMNPAKPLHMLIYWVLVGVFAILLTTAATFQLKRYFWRGRPEG